MITTIQHKIVGSRPAVRPGELERYWTPERRATATTAKSRQHAGAHTQPLAVTNQPSLTGNLPPARPRGDLSSSSVASSKRPRLYEGANEVADPLAYPYSSCGKLFFTQRGLDWAASAAMISPNILLTAAHCLHESRTANRSGWSTNLAFYPSYPNRSVQDPAFRFEARYQAAWTGWTADGNRAYDYGLIWIDNEPGHELGWLGLLWNASTSGRVWDAVGYPAKATPLAVAGMEQTAGSYQPSATPGTIGLSNDDIEHGSSGSPWITDLNGSAREYANGLQSFHVDDFVEYGPYLTENVKDLYDWISDPANRR